MRRAQAFGGSSPSASVCSVLSSKKPRLLAREAGAFSCLVIPRPPGAGSPRAGTGVFTTAPRNAMLRAGRNDRGNAAPHRCRRLPTILPYYGDRLHQNVKSACTIIGKDPCGYPPIRLFSGHLRSAGSWISAALPVRGRRWGRGDSRISKHIVHNRLRRRRPVSPRRRSCIRSHRKSARLRDGTARGAGMDPPLPYEGPTRSASNPICTRRIG